MMTKKEQAMVHELRVQLREARALRWSMPAGPASKVECDVLYLGISKDEGGLKTAYMEWAKEREAVQGEPAPASSK